MTAPAILAAAREAVDLGAEDRAARAALKAACRPPCDDDSPCAPLHDAVADTYGSVAVHAGTHYAAIAAALLEAEGRATALAELLAEEVNAHAKTSGELSRLRARHPDPPPGNPEE